MDGPSLFQYRPNGIEVRFKRILDAAASWSLGVFRQTPQRGQPPAHRLEGGHTPLDVPALCVYQRIVSFFVLCIGNDPPRFFHRELFQIHFLTPR